MTATHPTDIAQLAQLANMLKPDEQRSLIVRIDAGRDLTSKLANLTEPWQHALEEVL
jgi:hypothetical protein